MAYTATAAPIREPKADPEVESAPVARVETTLTVPCPTCDTLVEFKFSVEADPAAPGGVFRRGPNWDHCPECGAAVTVTDCAEGEHRTTELRSGGESIAACLVCGPRYRPAPLTQITPVGGDTA